MHGLRALTPREGARLRLLGERLRAAWCCSFNAPEARQELLEYCRAVAGAPGSEARKRFLALVEEFFEISALCAFDGAPYDRVRELCLILFPELRSFEMDLRAVIESI